MFFFNRWEHKFEVDTFVCCIVSVVVTRARGKHHMYSEPITPIVLTMFGVMCLYTYVVIKKIQLASLLVYNTTMVAMAVFAPHTQRHIDDHDDKTWELMETQQQETNLQQQQQQQHPHPFAATQHRHRPPTSHAIRSTEEALPLHRKGAALWPWQVMREHTD